MEVHVILETPWTNTSGRGRHNKIILPIFALFNCVVTWLELEYAANVKVYHYGPKIKRSLYDFDTSNKTAITAWATELITLSSDSLIDASTRAVYKADRKKDDMADALFLVCHHLIKTGRVKGVWLRDCERLTRTLAEGHCGDQSRQ